MAANFSFGNASDLLHQDAGPEVTVVDIAREMEIFMKRHQRYSHKIQPNVEFMESLGEVRGTLTSVAGRMTSKGEISLNSPVPSPRSTLQLDCGPPDNGCRKDDVEVEPRVEKSLNDDTFINTDVRLTEADREICAPVGGRGAEKARKNWTNVETRMLVSAHESPYRKKKVNWMEIAAKVRGRSADQCRLRWDVLLKKHKSQHHENNVTEEAFFQHLLSVGSPSTSGANALGQFQSSQRHILNQKNVCESGRKRKFSANANSLGSDRVKEGISEAFDEDVRIAIADSVGRLARAFERMLALKEIRYAEKQQKRQSKACGTAHANNTQVDQPRPEVWTSGWVSTSAPPVWPLHSGAEQLRGTQFPSSMDDEFYRPLQ